MFEKILNKYNLPLDDSISLKSETKTFGKGDIITQQGEVENHIYFIRKGAVLVGTFYKEKEAILDFWFEADYFSS